MVTRARSCLSPSLAQRNDARTANGSARGGRVGPGRAWRAGGSAGVRVGGGAAGGAAIGAVAFSAADEDENESRKNDVNISCARTDRPPARGDAEVVVTATTASNACRTSGNQHESMPNKKADCCCLVCSSKSSAVSSLLLLLLLLPITTESRSTSAASAIETEH